MDYAIIAVILVIIVMIAIMSIILKKTVRIVNEQSKNYFLSKLQSYDDIILEKEQKLKTISEEINKAQSTEVKEKKKNDNSNDAYYYPGDIPTFQEENFIEKYKKIDQLFSFDNRKIIDNFLKNNPKKDNSDYVIYLEIKNKLNFDLIYKIETSSQEEQIKILKETFYGNEMKVLVEYLKNNSEENFVVTDFKDYIEKLVSLNDPTIYIKVGNIKENYDYLDKRIKTEYNKSILKGVSIIYQNKIYDYTLS